MVVAVTDFYGAVNRRAGEADVEDLNNDSEGTRLRISIAAQNAEAAISILDDGAIGAAAIAPGNDCREIGGAARQIRVGEGSNHLAKGDFPTLR